MKDPIAPDECPADDGYDGPVELISGDEVISVRAAIAGHFDPISGRYTWYGRLNANPAVAEWVARGSHKVQLRSPYAQVATSLSDIDPWGRYRVEGFGPPPFQLTSDLDEPAE